MKKIIKKLYKGISGMLVAALLISAFSGMAFAKTNEDDEDPMAGRAAGQVLEGFYDRTSRASMRSVSECGTKWNDTMYYHNLDLRPYLKFQENKIQKGIDVAKWEGDIDWNAVKNDDDGIDFVMVRAAYRGTGTGKILEDEKFKQNMKGVFGVGLDCGVYFFSQAITESEAREEAEYVLEQLKTEKITPNELQRPIFMDVEFNGDLTGRLYNAHLSKEKQTAVCNAFIDVIEKAGFRAGIYANKSMFRDNMNAGSLTKSAAVWLAHYTGKTDYTGTYNYWQCSERGTVDGINGAVDLNFYYRTETEGGSSKELGISGSVTAAKKGSSADKITISWKNLEGADGYLIERSDCWASDTYKKVAYIKNNTYTDSGLEAGKEYYYVISPYVISGREYLIGNSSEICSAETSGNNKPRIITDGGSTAVKNVNLREHAGTGSIKILSSMPVGSKVELLAETVDSTGKAWYKVKYKSYIGYVSAAYTKPYTSGISGLKMSSYSTSAIKLSWSKSAYADGYVLYRASSLSGSYKAIKTFYSQNSLTFTHSKLKAGTNYYYKLKAFRKENGSTYYGAQSAALTAATKVSKPSGFAQNTRKTAKTSISMTWRRVTGADGYRIYRSAAKNGKYVKVKTITSGSTLSWTDKKKSSGTEYYYKIRAYKRVNGSAKFGDCSSAVTMHTKMASKLRIKTTKKQTMRSSAGTSYSKKVTVPKSKRFTVIYKTKDKYNKTWYKIKYTVKRKNYTGYIPASGTKKI